MISLEKLPTRGYMNSFWGGGGGGGTHPPFKKSNLALAHSLIFHCVLRISPADKLS